MRPTSGVRLSPMRRSTVLIGVVALLLALVAAGCDRSTDASPTPETVEGTLPEETTGGNEDLPALDLEGDAAAGEAIFASEGCGGCHTLSAANASGSVGPNLDEAAPSYEFVVERVTKGMGSMPSFEDSLTAQQIADVSAYVSENAGS